MRPGLLPRILRQITNGAFTPTLSSLGLSNSVFPENTTAGTIFSALTGMTGGSSLSLTTTDGTRVALSGTNITAGATSLNYEVDTTARSFQVTETLAGAVGSPKVTTLNYTIGNLNDTNPSAFTFTDVTGVLLSTAETSNLITVAGLGASDSATATLSGAASSQMSVNGGSYVSGPVTVVNGDTIAVRHTSSGSFSTATNTTLTIGTTSDTYTSTTGASDTVPDAFSFTDVSGAALSTLQTSAAITPAGYTAAATISITGGEYEINGSGTWVTSSGTISPAQSVKVRHTSSASNSTAVNTVLTIGGVSDTFTSTTLAASGTITAPALAFDATNGWVTGDNPPKLQVSLSADGSTQVGDILVRQYATGGTSFATALVTEYHTIDTSDVISGDLTLGTGTTFSFASVIPGGSTDFRVMIGRGGTGLVGGFATSSSFSNTVTDTLAGSSATAILDATRKSGANNTLSGTPLRTAQGLNTGGALYLTGFDKVALTAKFQFEISYDAAGGSSFPTVGFGVDDGTTAFTVANGTRPGENNSLGIWMKINNSGGNISVSDYRGGALIGSQNSVGNLTVGDVFTLEFDNSGAAGTHSYKVYRNGNATPIATRTGLTMSSTFNRGFIAGNNDAKMTFNPGNTFSHTLNAGYSTYG